MDYVFNADYETFSETSETRPWRRFWARLIDVFAYAMVLDFCFILILLLLVYLHLYQPSYKDVKAFLFWTQQVLWVFLEAYLLTRFGITLGKFLLNIKVGQENGAKPSYGQALRRTIKVFVFGMSLSLITYIVSYRRLKSCGSTSWDDSENLEVTTYPIGNFKLLITVILIMFIFFQFFIPGLTPWTIFPLADDKLATKTVQPKPDCFLI